MTPVGYVPYLTGNVVPFSSCHVYINVFNSKKFKIDPVLWVVLIIFYFIPDG
jgi:hypothetical protein